MALLDLALAAVATGLGALLGAVGLGLYRRDRLRPMLVTSGGFLSVSAGGAAYLAMRALTPPEQGLAETALLLAVVLALGLFYLALFGRRDS
jgi:hypothetical protein